MTYDRSQHNEDILVLLYNNSSQYNFIHPCVLVALFKEDTVNNGLLLNLSELYSSEMLHNNYTIIIMRL